MALQFDPVLDSAWVLVITIIAVLAAIILVTPPTSDPIQRRWLLAFRFIAAGMLIAMLARPAFVQTDQKPNEATLIIAIDTSESMSLTDEGNASRWEQQQAAWKELLSGIQSIEGRPDIQWLSYDRDLKSKLAPAVNSLDKVEPVGTATNISLPLAAAMQSANNYPLVGVVLMGDGSNTTTPVRSIETGARDVSTSPSNRPDGDSSANAVSVDQAVGVLSSIGVPLWTIPIGPPPTGDPVRDVAVKGLPDSERLFAGNAFDLRFEVHAKGLAGAEIPIRAKWVALDGTVIDAAARRLIGRRADDRQAVNLSIPIPPAGSYRLEVQAAPQEGERLTQNNTQVAFVDVQEGGGRIFYLEGQFRPEQHFIQRSLNFPDLNLQYHWIPSDSRSIWPIDFADEFTSQQNDVFIIGDLTAEAIGNKQWRQLADAVANGAGLITLGGWSAYSAGGYSRSPLSDVLPIVLPVETSQLERDVQLSIAQSHSITDIRLSQGPFRWQDLKPLPGASRLGRARRAPGVAVLLKDQLDEPMLVVGEYGKGRVASLAIDETYRWYRQGQQDFHRRFWRQLMLWLLSREEMANDEVRIDLSSRRFDAGSPPTFHAVLEQSMLESGGPDAPVASPGDRSTNAGWVAVILDEAGTKSEIAIDTESSDGKGLFEASGKLPTLEPGFYTLQMQTSRVESTPASMAFQVVDDDLELANPSADPIYLRQLADMTSRQGGRSFLPDEVDELVDLIREKRGSNTTTIVQKHRLGDGPLSGWIVFSVFAVALAAEWILRRRWGLV
ncbi:MAG: glutamine amidotransferase [Planctomycetota bacterium]